MADAVSHHHAQAYIVVYGGGYQDKATLLLGNQKGQIPMGNGFVFAGKCVVRASRAVGHALWQHFQLTGYILAMGTLPDDETDNLVNPELREYQKDHADV